MLQEKHLLLSPAQRHSYLTLLLIITEDAVTPDETFTQEDAALLTETLRNNYQLQLLPQPGKGYRLTGQELNKRICLFSHLRRLLRQIPSLVTEVFSALIEQRLTRNQRTVLPLTCDILYSLAPESLPRPVSAVISATNFPLFLLVMHYALGSGERVRFSARQRQWLEEKEWLPLASGITGYSARHGVSGDLLHADETRFWILLLTLLDVPVAGPAVSPPQQKLMSATGELIDRFSRLSALPLARPPSLLQRLYCHLSLAVERNYFDIGIDDSGCGDLIARYPGMFRITSQALAPFEQNYRLTFSPQETMLIALLLISGTMEACGYEERQIVILTDNNPELEQEVERILRESLLLPVTFHYQSLKSFCKDGAPRGVSLVISPYIVQLPLFSPPLIHAELPLNDHQQDCIRRILSG